MNVKLIGIAVAASLAGCATAPFSYIDGNRYFRTELNTFSVIVLNVDGRSDIRNPVMVDPGRHTIMVQAPAAPGFSYGEMRPLTIDVKACNRYYLKAVKKNPLEQEFVPEVDYVEPIAGCKA